MTVHTTPEMTAFVNALLALSPGSQNGGTYANKPGYHNTRLGNAAGNYSIVDAVDKLGPADMCAAVDWTFPNAQHGDYATIILYTNRLLTSARDTLDSRLDVMREFYGQGNQDQHVEGWDTRYGRAATSDPSHLWHIHMSFSRAYVASPFTYDAVLSVLRGESFNQWNNYPPKGTTVSITDVQISNIEHYEQARMKLVDATGISNASTDNNITVPNLEAALLKRLEAKIDALTTGVNTLLARGGTATLAAHEHTQPATTGPVAS